MLAGGLDRVLKHEQMTIDFATELLLEAFREVCRGNGTESLPGLAGLEHEGDLELANATGKIFRFVQLARFAFGAFRF